jgi:hypothetical protein
MGKLKVLALANAHQGGEACQIVGMGIGSGGIVAGWPPYVQIPFGLAGRRARQS